MQLSNPWPSNSQSNWNLEMLIFEEGGKPENPEKNPRSKDENQQQTQPTYDTGSRIRTRATLVGGERDHHCAIPALLLALEYNTGLSPVQINAKVSMLNRYVHVQDTYSYKPTQSPARRISKMCRS